MKKKLILTLFLFIVFSVPLSPVLSANLSDAFKTGDDKPLDDAADGAGYNVASGENAVTPEKIVGWVVQAVLGFLGIIFIVLMIYAGYLWMTARGNEQQAEKAKNLISAAVIGLVIVVSAYAISIFVMNKLSLGALADPPPALQT